MFDLAMDLAQPTADAHLLFCIDPSHKRPPFKPEPQIFIINEAKNVPIVQERLLIKIKGLGKDVETREASECVLIPHHCV